MSFHLLWCENCETAGEAPRRPDLPVGMGGDAITCSGCGEAVTLLECQVRGTLDARTHRTVAHWFNLPTR